MNSTSLVPMADMQQMAKALVSSKMFGFKTVEEALSIMLIAQAEGRSPALAARDYHVIQGRPALKADAMLARFQQEGGVVEWVAYTESKVSGKFSHPKSCPVPVQIEWTIDMAKRIGLASRDNWRNYPRAMLRARVISEGVRTTYPGIAVGIYTVEETQDFMKEKDVTPTAGAGDSLTEERRIEISDIADRVREWMLQGSLTDAYLEIENAALDPDEQTFLWTHFDSKTRRQLKEEGERQRTRARIEHKDATISDAQHRRLEARIAELKLNREMVKKYLKEIFGKDHFTELTNDDYSALDGHLEVMAAGAQPKAAAPTETKAITGAEPPLTDNGAAAPTITADEALALEARCTDNAIKTGAVKKFFHVERFSQMTAQQLADAHAMIDTTLAERRAKEAA